ncbi:UDP-N-acetylmuramyl peptide synthase [Legionella worsleiensis]|uniref:UDP-N-acetylmuramyl tripeptide synthase n=1 Tax=Legionella worsleiensis TaxID=45076 RepID=A0A0W1AF86_9GAMM|nr:UDP-N-acetylmuramyl peptide synthase [Legionella worsleiensis]KTD80005.1 UDP-N-acetylmuramyl tripeptide synthase [Legionella worsleiensis]STY32477.1 UDP-N-acetylmuramyl tripeptide synthase [Legionella worsleiensis]
MFRESENPFNNISSSSIATNKYCTSKILEHAGIPVPRSVIIHSDDFHNHKTGELIQGLKFPLVLKPLLDGSKGKDVLCNIKTLDQLLHFLKHYLSVYEYLLIEEFHGKLNSYRVLVFNRRVIGVVQRYPASITGDGTHTIEQLIHLTNKQRKIINDFLGPIVLDDEGKIKLKELGLTPDYVPSLGERVILAYTSNATRGGTYETLGKHMCKENRKLLSKVASVLNLDLAGIDVECLDLNIPITQSHGVIIEVNHRPSIRIHELPLAGKPQWVTKTIMRSFIYRHPLSYLHALFTHKPTSFYFRSITVCLIMALVFWLAI